MLAFSTKEIKNKEELDLDIQKIIYESANRVYKHLGMGHAESTYQKALMYELNTKNIIVDIERNLNVYYRDSKNIKHIITSDRIDLYVHKNEIYDNSDIILELKAVQKNINDQEIIQINKYTNGLKNENIEINFSIIINFLQSTTKNTNNNNIQFTLLNYTHL